MTQLKRLCVLVLAFLLIASEAQAAVKAGAACSKAGAVSTSAGKKYTCTKSGKRLVWNKGVAIAMIFAPSRARDSQIADPIPRLAPVTKANLLSIPIFILIHRLSLPYSRHKTTESTNCLESQLLRTRIYATFQL